MAIVRPAEAADVQSLATTLGLAFADDPLLNWLMPQRSRRAARRASMMALELETYVLPQHGLVFIANDGAGRSAGGCLTLPPGEWQMPTSVDGRTAVRFLRTFGIHLQRAAQFQRAMHEHHLAEPHYYVRTIGVRPGMQGHGLGQALMQPTLERCDEEGLPTYLEASSERSAALYARLGFVHLGAVEFLPGAPPAWPMRRPPRAAT